MVVHIPFATVETRKKTCGTVHLAVACGTYWGQDNRLEATVIIPLATVRRDSLKSFSHFLKCQMNKYIFMKQQGGEACIKGAWEGEGMNFQLLD